MKKPSSERARIHLLVGGRVQGVFFRAVTCDEARALALTGWVRNRRDGRVEIVAEGEVGALRALAAWANRGPRSARVDQIEEEWLAYQGEFAMFSVC